MDSDPSVTMEVPSSEDVQFLDDRLYEHNRDRTAQDDGELFGFFIRDERRQILAGITGWTWARACEIERLWVHPDWRGKGYGEQLLEAAEAQARARGCEVITLDSYSFQAPGFYQKNGYELAWQLEDFPPDHSRCYLVKRLSASG